MLARRGLLTLHICAEDGRLEQCASVLPTRRVGFGFCC